MNAVLRTVQRPMNFDIADSNGNQISLMYNNLTDNGNIPVTNERWYTLSGNVTQNAGPALHAMYPSSSWRTEMHPFNPVRLITVIPLASGDVDILID